MLDSFHASLLCKSLKLHFNSEKYDYFKFKGKLKRGDTLAARNKFLQNDIKFYYEQLGKHEDPGNLLVSNFLANPKAFITDIVSTEGLTIHEKRVGRLSSLYYNFEQELSKISSIKEMMSTNNGLPTLLSMYVSGELSPETIVIIDRVIKRLDEWQTLDHPLVEKHILTLRKYRPFVPINKDKIRKIFEKVYS